jgi:SAM-dependent methyltransferase
MERQRLQYQVLDKISENFDFSSMSILHIAPEKPIKKYLEKKFMTYHTSDLSMSRVDFNIDLRQIPFKDATYDSVFASHVLEHIKEDRQALSEIRRILKPGGFAILPVPLLSDNTIEYLEPKLLEAGHVRDPGEDYYERYHDYFNKVELYYSSDFPKIYQTNLYWNNETFKYIDIVPVCYV